MKKNNYKLIGFAVLTFFISSCDDFLDINKSPNSTTQPPPRLLLTGATTAIGFHMGSDIHRFTSEWVQQFTGGGASGTQTVEYARFNVTATDMNNCWRGAFFGDVLADLQQLRMLTEGTSPKYSGIAKICQAFMYSVAVDAWGNIPFSQAMQFQSNLQPIYDNSADIYTALFTLIDEGIADINNPTVNLFTPGTDDMVYGADANTQFARWIRFANSLKLRMLIKYYPTNATFADAQIAALLGTTGITFISSNAESFQLTFATVNRNQNPIDQFERDRQNQFWPTTTLVDLMNATADPRRPFYFRLPASGTFTGLAPAAVVTVVPPTSRLHTYLRGALTPANTSPNTGYEGNAPLRMLTFAEHNFNLAEYYLRTGQNAAAQTAYWNGVNASLTDALVVAADISAFIGSSAAPLNRGILATGTLATGLQQIIIEKYIANYGVAVQPWSDWRRTGYPILSLPGGAVLPAIPRILPYSDLERVTNPVNTPPRETTDLVNPNVFWDPGV